MEPVLGRSRLRIKLTYSPTDPVLAASVVKGTFAERHVPPFIRDLLLASFTLVL